MRSAFSPNFVFFLSAFLGCTAHSAGLETAPAGPARGIRLTALNSPSSASLRGLHVVSARVAFATGSGGTVLRTVDGGRSWQRLVVPNAEALDFRSVAARSATSFLVASAGQPARVYRSLDGRGFEVVHEDANPEAFFDSLVASPDDRVWLFGDPVAPASAATSSGPYFVLREGIGFGDSFSDHGHRLPPPLPQEAGFAASNSCISLDVAGRPCLVTSGPVAAPRFLKLGATSKESLATSLPMAHGAAGRGAFAVAQDSRAIVVVGGDYLDPTSSEGVGAWSHDGGRTFLPCRGLRGYRSGVSEVPDRPGTFVAIGPTGAEISSDGGRTFVAIEGLRGHAIDFAIGRIGFASGADGALTRIVLP